MPYKSSLLKRASNLTHQGARSQMLTKHAKRRAAKMTRRFTRGSRWQLVRKIRELQTENAALAALSITDELTGAYNRRYILDLLANDPRLSSRTCKLALCVFDIDHFKCFNDSYGHLCGDQALRAIAGRIMNRLRAGKDFLIRLGGDEFCLLLFTNSAQETLGVVERLQGAIRALALAHHAVERRVLTVSIGAVWYEEAHLPMTHGRALEIYRQADESLYEAKRAGRDCIKLSIFDRAHQTGLQIRDDAQW
jgi:diguanylate cyclase (GGDEF)-like protein